MSNDPNIAPPGKNPGSPAPRRRTVGMYDRPEQKPAFSPALISILVLLVLIAVALSIFLLTR